MPIFAPKDMDDILQWLSNGKDYQTGITLLEKHHRNRMLVQHFRHSTPNFAAAKLEYELRKLLKGKVAAAVKYKKIAFCKVIFVIFENSKNKRYE